MRPIPTNPEILVLPFAQQGEPSMQWIGHATAELLYAKMWRVPALNLHNRDLYFFQPRSALLRRQVYTIADVVEALQRNNVTLGVCGFASVTHGKVSLDCRVVNGEWKRQIFRIVRKCALEELDTCVSYLAEEICQAGVDEPLPAEVVRAIRQKELQDIRTAELLGLGCSWLARGKACRRQALYFFEELVKHEPACALGRFLWAHTAGPKVFRPEECERILRLNPYLIQAHFCYPFDDDPLAVAKAKWRLYRRGTACAPYCWFAFQGFRELCIRLNHPALLVKKTIQMAEAGTFEFAESISASLWLARQMNALHFSVQLCKHALKYVSNDKERLQIVAACDKQMGGEIG